MKSSDLPSPACRTSPTRPTGPTCPTRPTDLTDKALAGEIPEGIEDKTYVAKNLVRVSRRSAVTIALLIACAKRDNFDRDHVGFLSWMQETFPYDASTRSHYLAIGEMLLDLRDSSPKLYAKLADQSYDRLRALKQIPSDQLEAFLSRIDLSTVTLEDLKQAVDAWLGKAGPTGQPALPGFESAVLSFASAPPERVKLAITDDRIAVSTVKSGFTFLGAAIDWHVEHQNVQILKAVREQMIAGASALEKQITELEG